MHTESQETEAALLKAPRRGESVLFPKCKTGMLTHLHQKAKKSDCDWKCPSCGTIYRTIRMLKELPYE